MATTTVKVLAKELKRTSADLLEQLKAAGIEKGSEDESITDKDKTALLEYLQKAHGNAEAGARKKITLIKRESSEIRQADSAGRTRTVQVEVRKKRVLVKRGEETAAPTAEAAKPAKAATAAAAKPILTEEELEKRAAEATRQAELLARQEAEMKAAEEARQKEQALVQSVTNTATELVKANQNAKVEIQKRDAAIAAGNLKLRIPVKTTICPISATADTPAPSGDQPQPTAELDPAVGNALFDIAAAGDEAIRSLNACIAAYDQVREMYSK